MDDYENAVFEVEGRQYVKPEASLDERNQFIDTLKDVQAKNTAEINRNTYNLGSPVASNVGGLGGAEGLWKAQYQTPQTDAQVANLKSVAQQEALNTALTNLQNIYQNRYKQAQRAAYRRASKRNRGGGGGTTAPLAQAPTTPQPSVEEESTDVTIAGTTTAHGGETVYPSPWLGADGNPINIVENSDGEVIRLDGVVDKGSYTYNKLKELYPDLVD